MSEKLEYASARYREARETSVEAEAAAKRARSLVQRAEQLLAHHLSVLVEQHGKWAANTVEGTTFEEAQRAVAEWNEARDLAVRADVNADLAAARVNDRQMDVLDASRAR